MNVGNLLIVVTPLPSRHIRDVTNADVSKRSEREKHLSRRTVVKLTSAYVRLTTDSWDCPFKWEKQLHVC